MPRLRFEQVKSPKKANYGGSYYAFTATLTSWQISGKLTSEINWGSNTDGSKIVLAPQVFSIGRGKKPLVLLGFLTRFGALNIAIVMLVAILKVHSSAFFAPAGMEFPLSLLGSALALLIAGGGKASIDAVIGGKPAQTPAM